MTDLSELIARLENGFFYSAAGEGSDLHEQAAAMLRTLAAERDAALAKVKDLSRQIGAEAIEQMAEKLAAPKAGETVRVRIPVCVDAHTGEWVALARHWQSDECRLYDTCRSLDSNCYITAWITAYILLPEPVEVQGTVESADGQ